jgi:hypothetical protein
MGRPYLDKQVIPRSRSRCNLVDGFVLDQVGAELRNFGDLAGNGPIAREVREQEDCVWAQTFRTNSGHGGTHAELTGFVGGSADDRAVPKRRDNDGLSPQLRIALLHGRVERVHVDMHNLACSHAETILFLNPERVRIELVSACGSVGA